jgi:hypothetical protein
MISAHITTLIIQQMRKGRVLARVQTSSHQQSQQLFRRYFLCINQATAALRDHKHVTVHYFAYITLLGGWRVTAVGASHTTESMLS